MAINIDVWQAIICVILPAVIYFFMELKKQDKAIAVANANQERIEERIIERIDSLERKVDRILYRNKSHEQNENHE